MILFKPEMAQAILEGRKTITRRRGRRRWNVGAVHQCYTRPAFANPPGKPFGRVQIVSLFEESYPGQGASISEQRDAEWEGFRSWSEFCKAYACINGGHTLAEPCWRVSFKLVTDAEPALT